ncbi:hypothetical protein AAEX37_01952 [Oligella sp. MSHR50489EDL]|uniref:hypothetical protein n=1 Tax=Oligella sp. MSHR50489EDL TaxID=3139409 RepID=UPI003D81A927
MSTSVIERLLIEIGIDVNKFAQEADKAIAKNRAVEKSLESSESASKRVQKSNLDLAFSHSKANETAEQLSKAIAGVTKGFVGLFSTILVSTGLSKFVDYAKRSNEELFFLEKNLGISATKIKSWQVVAEMSGGSADGVTASLSNLSRGITDFVMKGDTSLLPYFNALGVSMVDSRGQARDLNDVMLDLADSLSSMSNRQQAISLASSLGLDQGTINTLLQGREAVEEMLSHQESLYHSNQEQIKASVALSGAQAELRANWDRLKLIIGNAVTPVVLKLTKYMSDFLEFLQRHERTVVKIFELASYAIGAILIPILGKLTVAALAAIAPFAPLLITVGSLGAAFALLYDDYKTWARGGESLFDWEKFTRAIKRSSEVVKELWQNIKDLFRDITEKLQPTFKKLGEAYKQFKEGDTKGGFKTIGGVLVDGVKAGVKSFDEGVVAAAEHYFGEDSRASRVTRAIAKNHQLWFDRLGHKLNPDDYVIINGAPVPKTDEKINKVPGLKELIELENKSKNKGSGEFTAGAIKGLTEEETAAYAAHLAHRESSNNMHAVNKWGYAGLYQFGASALAETGFIDRAKLDKASKGVKYGSNAKEHIAFLSDPDNWLIGDWEKYKASREMQDESLKRLTEKNLNWTAKSHGWDKKKMFGAAFAAHLKGAENANKWYQKGIDSYDGNKTYLSSYAKLGEKTYADFLIKSQSTDVSEKTEQKALVDSKTVPQVSDSNAQQMVQFDKLEPAEQVVQQEQIQVNDDGFLAGLGSFVSGLEKVSGIVSNALKSVNDMRIQVSMPDEFTMPQQQLASTPIEKNQNTNTVTVTLNGGVHVVSSASTIEGTTSDGIDAVRGRLSGLITGLS